MKHFLMIAAAIALLSCAGVARADQTQAAGATPAAAATKTKTPKAPMPNQFASDADAKAHCPADQIVWANNNSKTKIYHVAGDKYYGTTKHGAYMCQKDSETAGFRAAKPRFAPRAPKTP